MSKPDTRPRISVRVSEETLERLKYWAKVRNVSVNEYIGLAIDTQIRMENRDYDLPTAEVQRLNQLLDGFENLSTNVEMLENVVTNGFTTLLALTRGDSYFDDDNDR